MEKNLYDAHVKAEGQSIEQWGESNPEEIETTYVERVVPIELEDECHELIDNWLKSKGFNPEEL